MRISIISIALAMIVNLITIAVVTGFQQEVRQKVSGFGSHIFIQGGNEYTIYESSPIRSDQKQIDYLRTIPEIKSIAPVAYKAVLFQSAPAEIKYKLPNGKDSSEIDQNVLGATLKGIDDSYDAAFFKSYLVAGQLPDFAKKGSNEIVISQHLANKLHYELKDTVDAYFVRNQPIKRKFIIAGIYETGMVEFDSKIVLSELSYVQELNDWGIKASIRIEDTLHAGRMIIRADLTGGNGNYRCDWGKGFEGYTGIPFCPQGDTTIRLIASDFFGNIHVPLEQTTLPDTTSIRIKAPKNLMTCTPSLDDEGNLKRRIIDEAGYHFALDFGGQEVEIEITPGKGSSSNYVGGFELAVHDWDQLDLITAELKDELEFHPNEHNELLKVLSIKESQEEIFVWLSFLDLNVLIILILMILIGIINMGSALLVLILVRSNEIGLLKGMGARNWSIQKIFLYQAAFLMFRGMIWGNAIGLGLCFIQMKFSPLSLNPEVYYLSKVPVLLNPWHWLILNAGTVLVCLLALILPSLVISRVQPSKAIKFN